MRAGGHTPAKVNNPRWAPYQPRERLRNMHSLDTSFQVALRHGRIPLQHSAGELNAVQWRCMPSSASVATRTASTASGMEGDEVSSPEVAGAGGERGGAPREGPYVGLQAGPLTPELMAPAHYQECLVVAFHGAKQYGRRDLWHCSVVHMFGDLRQVRRTSVKLVARS